MIKRITLFLALVLLIAGAGFIYVTKQVDEYVTQPLKLQEEQIYTIETGMSFNRLLADLTNDKLIVSSDVARLVRRFHPELTQVKAGT